MKIPTKKSERYQAAMLAVLDDERIVPSVKLEIIETLQADQRAALFTEELEAKGGGCK